MLDQPSGYSRIPRRKSQENKDIGAVGIFIVLALGVLFVGRCLVEWVMWGTFFTWIQ